ncbi:MAG: prepilin-type N-terminal cleavage/methylation domain-containing protein [Candidatus Saganbacteria bacterium]|nr:prepilin-type N-terminal cleavage/methylation domain-containing protein [Candidatus Saganbacteria bacterium]
MKRRSGFTIMELLVVIGIIGVLLVFLVPSLMHARDSAKQAAVKGIMHSIQLGLEAYEMENLTYPLDNNLALFSLCTNYLMPGGYVATVPTNPYTGQDYTDADVAGKIIYDYDDGTGIYTLTGYDRSGTRQIQQLTNM